MSGQDHLFGPMPGPECLFDLPDPNFELIAWAEGHPKVFEALLIALVRNGRSVGDAIEFLNNASESAKPADTVFLTDLSGRAKKNMHDRAVALSERGMRPGPTNQRVSSVFACGRIAHAIVGRVWQHPHSWERKHAAVKAQTQLDLFEGSLGEQLHLPISTVESGERAPVSFSAMADSVLRLGETLEKERDAHLLISGKNRTHSETVREFFAWHFPDEVSRLTDICGFRSDFLLYTLMSLGHAAIHIREKNRHTPLFLETPVVLAVDQGISLGRVDGVGIASVAGEVPNKESLKLVSHLTHKKFPSLADLARLLLFRLGRTTLHIIDWKFAVGDGAPGSILTAADIEKPITRHVSQIERYIVGGNFGAQQVALDQGKGPLREYPFRTGELIYLLPSTGVTIHPIEIDEHRQNKKFTEIVDGIAEGSRNRKALVVGRALINAVERTMK